MKINLSNRFKLGSKTGLKVISAKLGFIWARVLKLRLGWGPIKTGSFHL